MRRLLKTDGGTFYCFSPPVMIATFCIEIVLAVYTVWRYKLSVLARLAVATLFFLALFQLSEYFVCRTGAADWSRVGFAAITMLPPLGVHTLYVLAGKKSRGLVWLAYATGALCIAYFLLYTEAFAGHACLGNYVIFQLGTGPTWLYAAFYYGWLATSLTLGWLWRRTVKSAAKRAIGGLIAGYLVFLVPTSVVSIAFPESQRGIPSIMCGFAVLFAFIYVLYILPQSGSLAHKRKR